MELNPILVHISVCDSEVSADRCHLKNKTTVIFGSFW